MNSQIQPRGAHGTVKWINRIQSRGGGLTYLLRGYVCRMTKSSPITGAKFHKENL